MKKILLISIIALSCKQDHSFLFADESYIDTTISKSYNIGYTNNITIAHILQDKGALIIEDNTTWLFIMDKTKSYHICIDHNGKRLCEVWDIGEHLLNQTQK